MPKQSRGEAHGLSKVLQGLFDLHTLFLDQIVLHVFKFHQHFLGVDLPLLQLLVSIFLDSLQMGQQCYFLVLLQGLFSLAHTISDVYRLFLLLLML